jgi:hypothetical protein
MLNIHSIKYFPKKRQPIFPLEHIMLKPTIGCTEGRSWSIAHIASGEKMRNNVSETPTQANSSREGER